MDKKKDNLNNSPDSAAENITGQNIADEAAANAANAQITAQQTAENSEVEADAGATGAAGSHADTAAGTADVSDADSAQANSLGADEGANFKIMSPGRIVMKRFFRSKLSLVGLAGMLFVFLFSFVGPLFSPYGEVEKVGAIRPVQIIFDYSVIDEETGEKYVMYEVRETIATNKTPPSAQNLLGTDIYGFDTLTRLMYGGRISLLLSLFVVFAETIIGVLLGSLAGFFGKWVDQVIMRLVDIFNCIPTLPILLISASLLDSWDVPSNMRIYYLLGILTFFGWAGTARLVRGQILSLREQEFMVAAEATGLSTRRRIFKHLLPNVMPQLIVGVTLGLGSIILYESTLSFLNLGVPFPYAAWGSMIGMASPNSGSGREILQYFPHLWIPAGVLIVMAVLSFNFIGDGLRDAFDPRARR